MEEMHPLKKWRLAAGVSRADLAKRLKRSYMAISRWEEGALPDREAWQALIDFSRGAVTPNDWFEIPRNRARSTGRTADGATA